MTLCANCGKPLDPLPPGSYPRPPRRFCDRACNAAHMRRRHLRGLAVIDAGLYWRKSRDKQALSTLCYLLDQFNREDRAAGRPLTPKPATVRARRVG